MSSRAPGRRTAEKWYERIASMENKLEVKKVPFMGTELVAARDANGQIWAGVRWLCDGMGLTEGQRKRQIANIQSDKVLSKGGSNLVLPTKGGKQEVLCLKLDFLPLWLAKINITPSMQAETPELAEKLEGYQLNAKDVLAEAFLPKRYQAGGRSMTDYQEMMAETRRQNIAVQKARLLNQMAADYEGAYHQVLQAYATKELTGEFLLPLPALPDRTYTAEEIGNELGISANMVGRLANANGLKTKEYGGWFVDKAKNANKEVSSFRYFRSVIPALRDIIQKDGT